MTEIVVTQADREAAASGYFAWCSGNPVIPNRMKAGTADDHSMVKAFARHRIAALEEAAKVAEQTDTGWMDARTFTAQKIAAAIRALKGPANG